MEKDILEIASIWDSEAEKIAFNILKRKINEEYYQISKHVSLKEIMKSNQKKPWMVQRAEKKIRRKKVFLLRQEYL